MFASALVSVSLLVLTTSAEPLKLAAPGFHHVNIAPAMADFYADHFAQELTLAGLHVVTQSEMAALLSVEQQKQLLGCADTSASCMAELANALGVDGIVTGSLGKFEGTYQLDIEILSARDATPMSVYSGRVDGDKALLDELASAAKRMTAELQKKMSAAPVAAVPKKQLFKISDDAPPSDTVPNQVVAPSAPGSPLRRFSWIPLTAGGLVAAGGVVSLVMAKGQSDALNGTSLTSLADARNAASTGQVEQNVGIALLSVGLATFAGGVVMYLVGAPAPARVSLVPTRGGVALSGVLP